MQNIKQFNLTKDGYFKPIIKKNCGDNYYITKQFLINILFPHFSEKKQQKILQKAKKLNIWNIENDIFEPITITFSTCLPYRVVFLRCSTLILFFSSSKASI